MLHIQNVPSLIRMYWRLRAMSSRESAATTSRPLKPRRQNAPPAALLFGSQPGLRRWKVRSNAGKLTVTLRQIGGALDRFNSERGPNR